MKTLFLAFTFSFTSFFIFSQNTSYNTQKGFVAAGYDVVAYFSNGAVKGKNEFSTKYHNVSFLFSSEENLRKFLISPERYIPQYGGYCAYAIAIKNKKISIDPKTFEIRNDKLYLFYNSWGTNTLALWLKENPDQLKETADKNWKKHS